MKITKKTRNQTIVVVTTLLFIAVALFLFIKPRSNFVTGFAGEGAVGVDDNTLVESLGFDTQQPIGVPPTTEEELIVSSSSGNNFVSGGSGSNRGGSSWNGNPYIPSNRNNNSTNNTNNGNNQSNQTQGPNIWGYRLMWSSQYFELRRNGVLQNQGEQYQGRVRFNFEKQSKKISDFDIDFDVLGGDVNLSNIFGDSDFVTGKSFLHHGGELENISLYVPVKPDDVAVVVCSNASSYDEIYFGCSELPHITNEEVLYLPHERVTLSSDGLYYIVSEITGTGATGVNVSVLGSSSAPTISPGEDPNAIAGNITELILPSGASGVTQSWQGYFGNVSGTIRLADSNDNVLYNWSLASPEGVILASTNDSITWNSVQCFNFTATGTYADDTGNAGETSQFGTNLSLLEEFYNIGSGDLDGVDETFTLSGLGTHNTFYINHNEFSEGECMNTRVFSDIGSGENDKFEEALLYEPVSHSVVFASLLNEDVFGFDGNPHDFEMLVLEDGHGTDTDTSTYYFYAQMY